MKNYITIAALLAAGTALSGAAVQTATWTGGTGDYTVAQASAVSNWNDQTLDWDSGGPNGGDPLAYTFACGGSVAIGSSDDRWLGMYTSDGGSWTVSNNTSVTIYGVNERTWTGDITVEAGSSLTINSSSLQLKDGTYKIDGALTIGWDIKFDAAAGLQTFALGSKGTLTTGSRLYTDGHEIKFTGTVDLGSGSTYVLRQRTLFDGVSQIRIDSDPETAADATTAEITALFNNSITADFTGLRTYDDSLDADALTADDAGKYFLSTNGKNIVLNYVSAVPEPSAFGLLAGLGALALVASRRRRK